ncbi:hypothetical protein LJC61_08425 [Ruminococcaceae bacterium OttesenSCG-928-A16]|nr:hypothetical protein [Ruminococcaceae bacterium OttesenSCG-928-A16]
MMRSFRNQIRYILQYIGIMVLAMLVAIPYMTIVLHEDTEFSMLSYQAATYFMLLLFSFLFICIFNSSNLMPALQFGATRKGWFRAMLVNKILFAAGGIAAILLATPVAQIFYGQPVVFGGSVFPLFAASALFMASYGAMLGYASARYGAKWLAIGTAVFFIVLIGATVLLLVFLPTERLATLASNPWLVAGLLIACIPPEFIGWLVLRKIPAKG